MGLLAVVVEDEEGLRLLYKRILENEGYDVLLATDGEEAIKLLKNHTPRIVFLDMLLPMVNGLDVLQYIASESRLANEALVVIITSASEFEQFTGMVPCSEFVLKPLLPPRIKALAQRAKTRFK